MATLNDVSRYALAYVPLLLLPIAAVAIDAGLPALAAALFPLGFLFLLVPAIELLTGRDAANHAPTQTGIADTAMHAALTWLMVPAWLLLLGWALGVPAGKEMDLLSTLVWFTSLGVVGGVCAINTAHELIHKPGRLEPGLGGILLASVVYAGFKVEHVRGHHVHVSTPEDASSAQLGQTVYQFLPSALWKNARNAWRLEARRLHEAGLPAAHWRNELIAWYALSLCALAAAGLLHGWTGAAGFLLQAGVAAVTLEIINYIEHYGLERLQLASGRYERVTHQHSWNASEWLTNAMLFQLQRHADHHANPRRRYQVLQHLPTSPQLPTGYAGMFVLALFPPLWRRVVDPRVHAWRAASAARRSAA